MGTPPDLREIMCYENGIRANAYTQRGDTSLPNPSRMVLHTKIEYTREGDWIDSIQSVNEKRIINCVSKEKSKRKMETLEAQK